MGLDINKMKAMNRPEVPNKDNLRDVGLTDDEISQVERFIATNGLNWQTIWALLLQYGPSLLQAILAIVTGGNPPVVTGKGK